jgi:hypothetical protein
VKRTVRVERVRIRVRGPLDAAAAHVLGAAIARALPGALAQPDAGSDRLADRAARAIARKVPR